MGCRLKDFILKEGFITGKKWNRMLMWLTPDLSTKHQGRDQVAKIGMGIKHFSTLSAQWEPGWTSRGWELVLGFDGGCQGGITAGKHGQARLELTGNFAGTFIGS